MTIHLDGALQILLTIAAVGVIAWALCRYIPMPVGIARVIQVVAIVV